MTAAVVDGGTDWGHPDMIGTWQTWTQADVDNLGADPGWVGWPKAFDPYSTLVLLALGPDAVAQNLSWYTSTQAATCTYIKKNGQPAKKLDKHTLCSVTFATRTGPARNFSAPDGTNSHTYTFPRAGRSRARCRLASHPDDYLLAAVRRAAGGAGHRPEHGRRQYDTAYVDLNDDYSFGDEKPVTKPRRAPTATWNGDGYTDLSGGLLYYISDGTDAPIPGGPTDFG